MATKLTKDVTRLVPTESGEINVTIGSDGVSMRRKGTQREVSIKWDALLVASELPESAPASALEDVERRRKWFFGK